MNSATRKLLEEAFDKMERHYDDLRHFNKSYQDGWNEAKRACRKEIAEALSAPEGEAAQPEPSAAGRVVVPHAANELMLLAGAEEMKRLSNQSGTFRSDLISIWRVMVEAATPPATPGGRDERATPPQAREGEGS